MGKHFILVDFENVQPKGIGGLSPVDTHVRIFAGATQSKVDLGLAQALQPFGANAEYIQITGSARDALDFHIAFYIGELSALHPASQFTIVSKDTGFDPLIKHLSARGIRCKRVGSLPGGTATKATPTRAGAKQPQAKAPAATKAAADAAPRARTQEVRERLAGLKAARPRTLKALGSSLKAWFKPALPPDALESLLDELQREGIITIAGSKVTYPT